MHILKIMLSLFLGPIRFPKLVCDLGSLNPKGAFLVLLTPLFFVGEPNSLTGFISISNNHAFEGHIVFITSQIILPHEAKLF